MLFFRGFSPTSGAVYAVSTTYIFCVFLSLGQGFRGALHKTNLLSFQGLRIYTTLMIVVGGIDSV